MAMRPLRERREFRYLTNVPGCGHIVLALRLIKRSTLRHYASRFPKADRALNDWARLVISGKWQSLVETRRMFPHADQVKVKSGRTVTIFNVCGNDFRLITAIHYDRKKVFVLNFLTHAEYSREHWKTRL